MKYNKNEVTGKMRDRIILQNVNRSRSLTGFASESWADVATIWAFAESKLPGSNETIIEGKNTAKNICDFTIRYISLITEESRVVFKNKIYQVKNIKISHDRRFISFQGVYYDSYSTVIGLQLCSASLLAQSSLSAALMRVIKYQASLNAFGSVSADINFVQKVASSLNANALLGGDISFVQKAQASLLTLASVTGNLTIPKTFNASLLATGTTTANLTVQAAGFDADAQAFFNRVTTAGGTLTTTEQNAVNTLVVQMKADGIWTKMKAIYPMVGASAAACAQNLKSASFTGTFSSGWTFASTGIKPNGTSAFMDTNLKPSVTMSNYFAHLGFYNRTDSNLIGIDIGCFTSGLGDNYFLQCYFSTLNRARAAVQRYGNVASFTFISKLGFFVGNTIANNNTKIYQNGILRNTNTSSDNAGRPAINIFIGAINNEVNNAIQYSNRECAFASIGDGLTDTEAANFYTAVQAFQTTLNRQVN